MYSEPDRLRALAVDHMCRLHERREERMLQDKLEEQAKQSERITDKEIAMWDKAAQSENGAGEVLLDMNVDFESAFQYIFHLYAYDRRHGTNRVRTYLDTIATQVTVAAKNIVEFDGNTYCQL